MNLTKLQIKKIIQEELAQLSEIEYDERGPMYVQPIEGETTPDDAEVAVRGYGGLRIDQIRRKLNTMLEESAQGDLKVFASFVSGGVMLALLETLKAHNALESDEDRGPDDYGAWDHLKPTR